MKSEDPLHFEEALHTEIKQWLPQISPSLDTIFFGGGTPSMTAYDSIAKAMEPLGSVAHCMHRQNGPWKQIPLP